jgi:hypothetical protein
VTTQSELAISADGAGSGCTVVYVSRCECGGSLGRVAQNHGRHEREGIRRVAMQSELVQDAFAISANRASLSTGWEQAFANDSRGKKMVSAVAKKDGYRGIHVVARYHPRKSEREPWDGHRVEIQMRTRLQHAFSTAVETVTAFTRQPLKFGAGPVEWRRFFSLMGSALALREGTESVPDTPTDKTQLIAEFKNAAAELKVR